METRDNNVSNINEFETKEVSEMRIDEVYVKAIAGELMEQLRRQGWAAPFITGNGKQSNGSGGGRTGTGRHRAATEPKIRGRKASKNLTPPDGPQLVVDAAEVFCVPGSRWSPRTAEYAKDVIRGLGHFQPVLGLVRQTHIVRRLSASVSKVNQHAMLAFIKTFFAELKACGWWLGPDPTRGINLATIPVATRATRLHPRPPISDKAA